MASKRTVDCASCVFLIWFPLLCRLVFIFHAKTSEKRAKRNLGHGSGSSSHTMAWYGGLDLGFGLRACGSLTSLIALIIASSGQTKKKKRIQHKATAPRKKWVQLFCGLLPDKWQPTPSEHLAKVQLRFHISTYKSEQQVPPRRSEVAQKSAATGRHPWGSGCNVGPVSSSVSHLPYFLRCSAKFPYSKVSRRDRTIKKLS